MADKELPLRRIREELGVSQETVARRTSLTTGTYRDVMKHMPLLARRSENLRRYVLQEHQG